VEVGQPKETLYKREPLLIRTPAWISAMSTSYQRFFELEKPGGCGFFLRVTSTDFSKTDRNSKTPVLLPSSPRTVGVRTGTWFSSVFLVFAFPLLFVVLVSASHSVSPAILKTCISLFERSPLGATIIIGYVALIYFVWGMSNHECSSAS